MTSDDVKWDAQGLAPAIVQDAASGEVLALAWMNRESLRRTLETRLATFWSRSRGELWVKGSTSGNSQAVRAVALDCDQDAILVRVDPAGPACHTGARSCFLAGDPLLEAPPAPGETLTALERVLRSRKQSAPEGSYTAKLFADEALRHKKVGEEASEVASLRGNRDEIAHEAADLLYHALVLLQAHGMGLQELTVVLRSREGKRK